MSNTTTTRKTYSISKIKKLIDVNNDMINFKLNFNIVAHDTTNPFSALIVNQSTLDNTEQGNLEYKLVHGSLSGEVIADKNVYQNYFIILKADVPMDVDVELQTLRLPDHIETKTSASTTKKRKKSKTSKDSDNTIVYILVVIGVVAVLFYIMNQQKTNISPVVSSMHQSLLSKLKKLPLD